MNASRAAVLLSCVLVMGSGCAPAREFKAAVSHTIVDGSPGFSPSIKLVTGRNGTITVKNTLDAEHGFSIEELKIKEVVPAGETKVVQVKDLKPVDYEFFCQLHDLETKKGKHQRGVLRVAQ